MARAWSEPAPARSDEPPGHRDAAQPTRHGPAGGIGRPSRSVRAGRRRRAWRRTAPVARPAGTTRGLAGNACDCGGRRAPRRRPGPRRRPARTRPDRGRRPPRRRRSRHGAGQFAEELVRAGRGPGRAAAVPVRAGVAVRGRRHGGADRLLGSRRGEAEDAGQHAHHAGADQRPQTSVGRVAGVFRQRRPGYRQVTDLPSRAGRPPVHLAAEERRHPETDADPHQDEVVQAASGAAGPLGHARHS